ncbi:5-formyltetrahydrofolate cyclo-ligase [Candidatus Woesearchaeota archaeon]|nr:5-formyltetrahydrofolate cyclo-ligase [Candidatus Woesearchaeota archaeon]
MPITKEQIRKRILEKRNALSQKEVKEKSEKIMRKLEQWKEFQRAKVVMFYVSKGKEVHTHTLFKTWLEKKIVCVPYVANEEMFVSRIDGFEELEKGSFDVLEPVKIKPVLRNDIDVVLVPGIAFDKRGYRIGYGLGYYDMFLKGLQAKKIGLAYKFQIVQKIPKEPHDVKMDKVITD